MSKVYSYGSPGDRGSADRYYGRGRHPHWYPNGTGCPPRVEVHEMTKAQIKEYNEGFDNETDRKLWW